MVENQRRRLLSGVGTALVEQGYAGLTVRHVIEIAGVSRTTFYANFANKRDAVLTAHHEAFRRLVSTIQDACAGEHEWPEKVRAAVARSLTFMAEEPAAARLLTLSTVATDLTVGRQMVDSSAQLAALLREGRSCTPLGPSLPQLTEDALIGGITRVLASYELERDAVDLADLSQAIARFLLTPYIGREAAARVAAS